MQAYALRSRLIGLPGLCVCYKFLTEIIGKDMNDTSNYTARTSLN
jgi:hypothetical protein